MAVDPSCTICGAIVESSSRISGTVLKLVQFGEQHYLLEDFLSTNLRNKLIFDSDFTVVDSVIQQSKRKLRETMNALWSRTVPSLARVNRNIQWEPPPKDWFKINKDGDYRLNSGLVTCGGVIRNLLGERVLCLSKIIGCCSIFNAELRGIYEVEFGIGACFVYDLSHVTALIRRNWRIILRYSPREGNGIVNCLANLTWNLPEGVRTFYQPPAETLAALHKDILM
ncbi:hypothetical protein F3Y22_tig00110904pilonHSYRG00145 [Hibiscus syriacus]|uniref:RNase H type-1 domain-containing protein n=1 Tax=Hibiscus syriacus TaxID=106335 RepID=A0A6A2ZF09_HIBSY|nr:hypothetical protein F3Y22_tig00110904pilonHSYRG00145 [Hibiscus syriacus]